MIKINCPECDKAYSLKDSMAGKKIKCKGCEHKFLVPGDAETNGTSGGAEAPESSDPAAMTMGSDTGKRQVSTELTEAPVFGFDPEPWDADDMSKIEYLKDANAKIMGQLRKAVVGQDQVVRLMMLGLFSQGLYEAFPDSLAGLESPWSRLPQE